jgi:hypothetical protein
MSRSRVLQFSCRFLCCGLDNDRNSVPAESEIFRMFLHPQYNTVSYLLKQSHSTSAAMAFRRSTRLRKNLNYYENLSKVSVYPEGLPDSEPERMFHALNLEAFTSKSYARVDDILVYSLFATKVRHRNYRALDPYPIGEQEKIGANNGRSIAKICFREIDAANPTWQACVDTAGVLKKEYPKLFLEQDSKIMSQYVSFTALLALFGMLRLYSLLLRYSLLHSAHSLVKLDKVTYGGRICAGLRATQHIPACTFILTTCSSMSSDLYGADGGFSIIESTAQQLGPIGQRLILGPFRFANHECEPNCQVSSFPIPFLAISLTILSDPTNLENPCMCPHVVI